MNKPLTIWKYVLPTRPESAAGVKHEIPRGASQLHVATQYGRDACVWFEVDPGQTKDTWTFRAIGTGMPFENDGRWVHIGTTLHGNDTLVLHWYCDFGDDGWRP